MRVAGIIGGIGPESTIEYYRQIVAAYRERRPDGSTPPLVVNSIDLKRMIGLFAAGRLSEVTEFLLKEIARLHRAGARFGALAANTPHLVFADLRRRSPIPLVSIVEATCLAARSMGFERVGLFGTRFTMQARFYPDALRRVGVSLVLPRTDEQDYVHAKYMGELVNGVVLPETRDRLLGIVERLRSQDGIQGLILGGTELALILKGTEGAGVPFLDTTRLHVEQIVMRMFSPVRSSVAPTRRP
jgi:aspartate racemase